MPKITFLAEEKCVSSSIYGSIDSFSIANLWCSYLTKEDNKPLFETEIVTIDGKPVVGNGCAQIHPDKSIFDVKTTDIIMIPAFLPPFEFTNKRMEIIGKWLKEHYSNGITIATTCTGTFLIAEIGLLKGKSATTNWMFANIFKKKYPDVKLNISNMLTEDEKIICTGSATAFLNLCIYLIEKFGSKTLAIKCSKALLIDPSRQSQFPYMEFDFWKNHNDIQILKAQKIMEEHFKDDISIDNIAENVGISSRHFKRRFKNATSETPINYLQKLRIEKAKQNLENSTISINEVIWQVGYEDVNSFRKLFRKHTGMSPKEYRKKFSFRYLY
ncbi:MAG: helix-turn-helix domain-containing protein [Desulfobacterales bacterium]|nr:helix-turn-helix domain-containing protein [Desulfobacterales bacterium]MBF0396243.1 helix-turn-helix domain-containing protein [Desulfobacterales bacterium]